MLQLEDYTLPRWANALCAHVRFYNKVTTKYNVRKSTCCVSAPDRLIQAPKQRYALGIFPTPLHRWHPPGVPEGVEIYIKRDDLSGMQLSGNKVYLYS